MPTNETEPIELRTRITQEVSELTTHEGGLMRGQVPLELIDDKNVPVNHQNLETIGTQLDEEAAAKGSDGQIQPIMLGYVESHERLHIIDGFHRFSKFKDKGLSSIYATIVEVTFDELLDKRIQNTSNHSGLQFARATQWVRESWSLHPLSERIAATQAFVLGRLKTSTGSRLGLLPHEVEDIMKWVDHKSTLWGLEPLSIYGYLNTDEKVASDLVHNSRPDPRQSAAADSLPQSTLTSIGRQLPNRHELQRTVASAIVNNKLGGSGISAILRDVKGMSDQEAIVYIASVDFAAYKEKIAQKPVYKYEEDDILRLGRVRESSRVRPLGEIVALTTLQIKFALEEGEYDADRMAEVGKDILSLIADMEQAATLIETTLAGETPVVKSGAKESGRTTEEFTEELAQFMHSPSGNGFKIRSDREAQFAERALKRGRGTKEALGSLQKQLEKYHAGKK